MGGAARKVAIINIKSKKPLAIIAHTTKGRGVNFMENNPEWHHKTLSKNLLNQIISKKLI